MLPPPCPPPSSSPCAGMRDRHQEGWQGVLCGRTLEGKDMCDTRPILTPMLTSSSPPPCPVQVGMRDRHRRACSKCKCACRVVKLVRPCTPHKHTHGIGPEHVEGKGR